MIDNIITLIIAEAKARDNLPLPAALRDVMLSINNIMESKIQDLGSVGGMDIPDKEKQRIIEMILQAD